MSSSFVADLLPSALLVSMGSVRRSLHGVRELSRTSNPRAGYNILDDRMWEYEDGIAIFIRCVNHQMQRLTLAKRLWVSVLNDLRHRGLMETWPSYNPTRYTTEELISQIKRLVVGPEMWRQLRFSSAQVTPPRVLVKLCLPSAIRLASQVLLINGGRHVVLAHVDGVEMWEVASRRRIWIRRFVGELSVPAKVENNILVMAMIPRRSVTLEIWCIDLQDGSVAQTLEVTLQRPGALSKNAVLGDFVAVNLEEEIVLLFGRINRTSLSFPLALPDKF
ncbi:hypothetical protein C8R46DRAFT_1308881 [Mycena filopes]|nr:hypothetical protein C8R46DRAFT_1308881 [Mycena filopes]